jgi:hypothetical protein
MAQHYQSVKAEQPESFDVGTMSCTWRSEKTGVPLRSEPLFRALGHK